MAIYKITKVVKEVMTSVYSVTVNVKTKEAAELLAKEKDMELDWYEDSNEMQDSELQSLTVEELA
jgi:hypothetical protein